MNFFLDIVCFKHKIRFQDTKKKKAGLRVHYMGYMKSDHIFALAYFAMLYNVGDMKTLSSSI